MIILGVDTSLRSTGFGVLRVEGSRLSAVEFGRIANAAREPLTSCLVNIHTRLTELITAHRPAAIAIESVIYAKNASTMLILGQARGAALTAATQLGVPCFEYEPRRVKMAVCGNGLAPKEQVQRMIKVLLNLPELPQNDAADALALAITHTHSHSILNQQQPL